MLETRAIPERGGLKVEFRFDNGPWALFGLIGAYSWETVEIHVRVALEKGIAYGALHAKVED